MWSTPIRKVEKILKEMIIKKLKAMVRRDDIIVSTELVRFDRLKQDIKNEL